MLPAFLLSLRRFRLLGEEFGPELEFTLALLCQSLHLICIYIESICCVDHLERIERSTAISLDSLLDIYVTYREISSDPTHAFTRLVVKTSIYHHLSVDCELSLVSLADDSPLCLSLYPSDGIWPRPNLSKRNPQSPYTPHKQQSPISPFLRSSQPFRNTSRRSLPSNRRMNTRRRQNMWKRSCRPLCQANCRADWSKEPRRRILGCRTGGMTLLTWGTEGGSCPM